MKIFKNGVGRPSNKTIRNRKIILSLSVILSICLILFITLMFTNNKPNKIKGAAKGTCDVWVDNITNASAVVNWDCNGNKLNSIYVYRSNKDSKAISLIELKIPKRKIQTKGSIKLKNSTFLKKYSANKFYLVKVKVKNKSIKQLFSTSFYKIKYNGNGANGNMKDQTVNYLEKTKLNSLGFEKKGYKFIGWKISKNNLYYGKDEKGNIGWYQKPDKYTYLKDEEEIVKLGKNNDTIILIAQWKSITGKELTLKCPKSALINKTFKCTTNITGVTLNATKDSLASGYSETFVTTKNDMAKDLKYVMPQTVEVVATKSGYETAKATVEIYLDNYGDNYKEYDDGFIYYSQKDYKSFPYKSGVKNDNIAISGCGTTSMAMVLSTLLKDKKYNPAYTTNEACLNGYCNSYGTDSLYFGYAAKKRGLKYKLFRNSDTQMTKENLSKVVTTLHNGGLAMVAVNAKSPFTDGGHFIAIRAIEKYDSKNLLNSTVYTADPNHPELTGPYKLSDFLTQKWITGIYLFNTKEIK